jgi:hypothetical protein
VYASSDIDCGKVKDDFLTSEKPEKETNQIDAHTRNNEEGNALPGSSSAMENVKQERDKLSVEDSSQRDIAPVFDKLLQPAPEEVCRIVLDLFTFLVQGCRTCHCVNIIM